MTNVDHVTLTRAFKREAKRYLRAYPFARDEMCSNERYFLRRVARGKLGRRDELEVHHVGKGAYQAKVSDPKSGGYLFADF